MSPSGLVFLLISAMSCCAAPQPENDRCPKPEPIEGAQLQGEWNDDTYPHGKVANLACPPGFTQDGPIKMACIEGTWFHIAKGQCKDKKCDRPDIKNGNTYNYNFPIEPGRSIDYWCNTNYVSHYKSYWGRTTWGRIKCTNLGWDPEPKCTRQCSYRQAYVENAEPISLKSVYLEGEKITFKCKYNYQTPDGENGGEITCLPNGEFTPANCSKTCQAPELPNGKITPRQDQFEISEYLEYECNKGYMTEKRKVSSTAQCLSDGWSEKISCIQPCTARERDMEENNIQLKWIPNRKLYAEHGDSIAFQCKYGYEAPSGTAMRSYCLRGKLSYPKCFRRGFCVLDESAMLTNNINYSVSSIVENGQTITFQCIGELKTEDNLEAKCEQGKISYPKCVASKPCRISTGDLRTHNIQLLPSDDPKSILDSAHLHGTELGVTCLTGFRRLNQASFMIECYDGDFRYRKCFSGKTCRIDQDELHINDIILDEMLNSDVLYEENDDVYFKCKTGSKKAKGKCSEGKLSYPSCRAQG
ncbi:complement factor H-related protein 4-like isoform X2 [Dendropsophus ebraccatus]|uniref:complement factor H-related protein 4-like isoform X2 n=1 Tax=Dendropsophus ebraccatus TaxID=150705 RepID=UPI003831D522